MKSLEYIRLYHAKLPVTEKCVENWVHARIEVRHTDENENYIGVYIERLYELNHSQSAEGQETRHVTRHDDQYHSGESFNLSQSAFCKRLVGVVAVNICCIPE